MNLQEQQRREFLESIATQRSFSGDTRSVFISRFDPANADTDNSVLSNQISWNRKPENPSQKFQDELTRICQELENDGCPIERGSNNTQGRGRSPKGMSPWEQVFKWLWGIKFLKQSKLLSSQELLINEKTKNFVGRDYVFTAIKNFIATNTKGYLLITGDPGMGKSSIMAKYVKDNNCIAYFNVQLQGKNRADQFLESICIQLIERYKLPYSSLPKDSTKNGDFLGYLLEESASQNNKPIVIIIDALDEVDENSQGNGSNILYLPPHLPDGVFFILSYRRGVNIQLTTYPPVYL